ncbi:MAG: hypothetical protein JXQ81_12715 [Desulfuromonadales bacterium]|nr:hypothetical protein [Desulfuromonadales bacterium]MBN2793364.1 hypothetical protein [Desulfuromonadales bacterium]
MAIHTQKKPYRPHERLFLAGCLAAFEQAVLGADKVSAIRFLKRAGFDAQAAEEIITEIFAEPRRYGYCPGGCLNQQADTKSRIL